MTANRNLANRVNGLFKSLGTMCLDVVVMTESLIFFRNMFRMHYRQTLFPGPEAPWAP
jgi:hypothetical protein